VTLLVVQRLSFLLLEVVVDDAILLLKDCETPSVADSSMAVSLSAVTLSTDTGAIAGSDLSALVALLLCCMK
jgi:hypothetical protein